MKYQGNIIQRKYQGNQMAASAKHFLSRLTQKMLQ